MTHTTHMTLKPLIISRAGMILFETLANCAELRSKKRTAKTEKPLYVNCFYEFPFYPVEDVDDKVPRVDAVAQVFFSGAYKYGDSFTVAIEIKESLDDMYRHPQQIESYVGHTDFLMLGVNKQLIPDAIKRVEKINECGVFDICTGKIYKAPKKQEVRLKERLRIQETFLITFNRQKEVSIVKSERCLGQNTFDLNEKPEDQEKKAVFWENVIRMQAERDTALSKIPYDKKMTAYFDLTKRVEYSHRQIQDKKEY